jgi:hypothetical protein
MLYNLYILYNIILIIRDKSSYIEAVSIQVFRLLKIEIFTAEKRKPPASDRRASNKHTQ